MLKTSLCIFYLEMVILFRRSNEWLYPLAFFIIVILLFPLALSPDTLLLEKILPGSIWIAALLASLLSVQNIFLKEFEDAHIEQMVLESFSFSLLIFIKIMVYCLIILLPLLAIVVFISFLLNLKLYLIGMLCISLFLGMPILILLGSLCAALTQGLRQQGVLLGLIMLPLSMPILILGVTITQQSAIGLSANAPMAFLGAISMFALSLLPWVIAMTLKISVSD